MLLLFTGVSYQVIWWCTHPVKLQVALKSSPAFVCAVTYLVIYMKSCFFHRWPVMTKFVKIFTVQVTSSCSLSWPYCMALVLRGLLYNSLATSGAYAAFRLTISTNVEDVTCQFHCTITHQIGHHLINCSEGNVATSHSKHNNVLIGTKKQTLIILITRQSIIQLNSNY